jgi:hypothetical protein
VTYPDTNYKKPELFWLDSTGSSGLAGDTGTSITYILGPEFKVLSSDSLDTNDVKPFVGIGLNLVDEEDSSKVFNMDSANIQGIYFDYYTFGPAEYVYVSFLTRQKLTEEGARFYTKIPAESGGGWQGAIVPFENIDLPPWDDKDTVTFDPTKVYGLQWNIEGDSGSVGALAIDNVYLLDTAHVGIKYLTSPISKSSGFSLRQVSNRLIYTLPANTKNAIVQLFNLQGRTIYSQRIKANISKSYILPVKTNTLGNGVYIFRAKTLGADKRVFTKSITLMK